MTRPSSSKARQFFPLTPYQRGMMLAPALDPQTAVGYYELNTLQLALRITPGLPPRTLSRAFDKLVARHDSLRLRLVEHNGEWQAEILPKHPTGLLVKDFGPLLPEAQLEAVRDICSTHISPLSPTLFELHLLKFADKGDVILVRVQHSVIDAYGMAILAEELLKMVLRIPVVGKPLSHGEFTALRQRQLLRQAAEKRIFWEETLLHAPAPLNLGRQKKGLPPLTRQTIGRSVRLDDILCDAASKRLAEQSRVSGLSVFCHLKSTFAEALCAAGDAEAVLLLSILGRQDTALSSFIGAAMQGMRMVYKVGDGPAAISKKLLQSIDMLPTTAFNPDSSLGALYYPFFVNIPNPVGRISSSPFQKSFEDALKGKVSVGSLSVERLRVPKVSETDYELKLDIFPDKDRPQAALIAEAASWDTSDMQALADGLNTLILE